MRFLIGIILNRALIFTLLAPLVVEALVAVWIRAILRKYFVRLFRRARGRAVEFTGVCEGPRGTQVDAVVSTSLAV